MKSEKWKKERIKTRMGDKKRKEEKCSKMKKGKDRRAGELSKVRIGQIEKEEGKRREIIMKQQEGNREENV